MSFHMKTEMIGTGKGAIAGLALKGSIARVFAIVSERDEEEDEQWR